MQARARAEWWFSLLASLPAITIASVYAEALLASFALGHWPIPSVEDPKDLPTAPLHAVSTVLVLSVLPGALFLLAILLKNWRVVMKPSIYWVWIAGFAVSLTLYFWLPNADPSTWQWWWD